MKNPEKRLNRFYGDVAKDQNADIIKSISGKNILDIGCGYGNLINQIKTEEQKRAEILAGAYNIIGQDNYKGDLSFFIDLIKGLNFRSK